MSNGLVRRGSDVPAPRGGGGIVVRPIAIQALKRVWDAIDSGAKIIAVGTFLKAVWDYLGGEKPPEDPDAFEKWLRKKKYLELYEVSVPHNLGVKEAGRRLEGWLRRAAGMRAAERVEEPSWAWESGASKLFLSGKFGTIYPFSAAIDVEPDKVRVMATQPGTLTRRVIDEAWRWKIQKALYPPGGVPADPKAWPPPEQAVEKSKPKENGGSGIFLLGFGAFLAWALSRRRRRR